MISIVVPLYNKEQSIVKTINSVLTQSFGDFELIIVDDGSTDNSVARVKEITDKRITLIEKENGGVSSARNMGILAANNKWIAFLDADDLWHMEFLVHVIGVIKSIKGVKVITTNFANVRNDGSVLSVYETHREGFHNFFEITNKQGWHITNMSTLCVFREELLKTGLFALDKTHGEDIELVEKLARMHKFWVITNVLSYYVQDAENRAMLKSPDIYKTRVYNIDTKLINGFQEKLYFKNAVLNASVNSFINKRFKIFYILIKKYFGFITFSEFMVYFSRKIYFKIFLRSK